MSAPELLPCPFCGFADELYPSYDFPGTGPCLGIDCLRCGFDFVPRKGMDVYRAWNTRSPLSQARDEALEEAWKPIETVPKDGTTLDLWHREFGRHPDCYWGLPSHECGEAGQYCDSDWHNASDGWVDATFNEFTFGAEGFTHWRRPPAPPAIRNLKGKQ